MRPKDEGIGLMASAFKGRALGFAMKMVEQQLEMVNEFRRTQRPSYMDKLAALKVYGDAMSDQIWYQHPSLFYLTTERTPKAIGLMIVWFCSWKIAMTC